MTVIDDSQFATTTTYGAPSGALEGEPTRVAPDTYTKEHGFEGGGRLPAEWLNYMLGKHGDALAELNLRNQIASYSVIGSGVAPGDKFNLTELFDLLGSYTVVGGNEIQVPAAGIYRVTMTGLFRSSLNVDPALFRVQILRGASFFLGTDALRYSTDTNENLHMGVHGLIQISAPASDKFSVIWNPASGNGTASASAVPRLTIERLQ